MVFALLFGRLASAMMNLKNNVRHNSFRYILGEHLVAPLSFGFALVRGA